MEHRLVQPASREQIVAIIRQRAERNRERGGGGGGPGANPGENGAGGRPAGVERRRFQAVGCFEISKNVLSKLRPIFREGT